MYIRDNNTLGLKSYAYIKDAPLYDPFRQDIIETENQLMDLSDSSWQDFTDTGISTGAYIIFYHCGPIDHDTHVPGPVSKSGAESEDNSAFTAGMALANFRMLIHELLNKDPYIFLEEAPLNILYNKSTVCMAKNGKDTKKKRHIF